MEIPPLSLEQLSNTLSAKKRPTQFFKYDELSSNPADLAFTILSKPARFLFYTGSENSEVGHWTAMRVHGKHIYWFSSYGFLPDGELMSSPSLRNAPGQGLNKLSAALELLRQRGFTIHYSSIPLQTLAVPSMTCGLWCLMFLTARIDNFEDFEDRLSKLTNPDKYAAAIYRKEYGSLP